jgi:hypothetical protein
MFFTALLVLEEKPRKERRKVAGKGESADFIHMAAPSA